MRTLQSRLRAARVRAGDRLRRSRAGRITLIVLGVLLLLGVVLDQAIDRPLRGVLVRRINDTLVGYNARVGRVNFHLLGLSLDLEDAVVHQNMHPDPPVLNIPRLRLSVHWRDLLYRRLVGDATFEHPTIHANLTQLREESKDPVPIGGHGWQEALEAIYPLKLNELAVTDGTLVYQDDSGFRPLHLSKVELRAGNIRNIRSRDRTYPSTLHAEGVVFDQGWAKIDGQADFMAEPTPGVKGRLEVGRVELNYFEPIVRRFGLTVRQGFLSGAGEMEIAPSINAVDLESVVLTDAAVDYIEGPAPTPLAREAGEKIESVAKKSLNNPQMLFRIRRLLLKNGTLGIVNKAEDPPYRLYFTNADFSLLNLSSRAEDGPARATVRGQFMGSGDVDGNATFYPEGKQANFGMKIAVNETELKSLNDLLRAKGKFDVTRGTLSVYAEVRVQNGAIEGYVKPLFKDVDIYDSEQDKHKNVFRKMYEGIVGGVAKLLENKRDQVATVTSLKGPVDDPKANAVQIIAGLVRNAFIKSIVPGFQAEVGKVNPMTYRAMKKEEREAAKQREEAKQRDEAKRRAEEGEDTSGSRRP